MADVKTTYGTEAQAITCTLASLASAAAREGTVVDNTVSRYLDVLVSVVVKLQAGTPGLDKRVYVWAYGTVDAATPTYPDAVTGSDAAITLNSPKNLPVLLGVLEAPTSAGTFKGGPWSLAKALGSVPEKWGLVFDNQTGIALDATEGNHKKLYQGVYATIA